MTFLDLVCASGAQIIEALRVHTHLESRRTASYSR